jgi:PHD/YefM family antitoxin component YafN of YafNO toxin-antitoxin module
MNDTIEIPVKEYEAMKEELALLKNNKLLEKMNKLIELLYEDKYGLYLGNNTQDLTEASIQKDWPPQNSAWDNV